MTRLYAYIDETGDLGADYEKTGTSQYFGMAGLVMTAAGAADARDLVVSLKQDFKIPNDSNLSWKDYVRKHERRKYVSQRLAELEDVKVIYVFTDKKEVNGPYVKHRGYLYNYVAGKMFKNILYAAQHWGCEDLTVRFSHVKGFDHASVSEPYLRRIVKDFPSLKNLSELKWVDARCYKESDVADLFAGCLNAALRRDNYGNIEGSYLQEVWHLVRNTEQCETNSRYCAIPLGMMPMPHYRVVEGMKWFLCEDCPQMHR